MSRFNRTTDPVDWAAWSWNPIRGCSMRCRYCYAEWLSRIHGEDFRPVILPDRLDAPRRTPVPRSADPKDRRVFVCSMSDILGRGVPDEWIQATLDAATAGPSAWEYIFLTKRPERFREFRWPAGSWLGTTVDVQARALPAVLALRDLEDAAVRWISAEPLLEPVRFGTLAGIDWIVIGAQRATDRVPEFQPRVEWVRDLVEQARFAGARVFLKSNLRGLPADLSGLREVPDVPRRGEVQLDLLDSIGGGR